MCIRDSSFTLGGTGASIVYEKEKYDTLLKRGLEASPIHEVMIDKALIGWKEYELELLRDKNDNVVIICTIENMDPMGIHTSNNQKEISCHSSNHNKQDFKRQILSIPFWRMVPPKVYL